MMIFYLKYRPAYETLDFLHCLAAKTQTSMHFCAVLPKPLLLAGANPGFFDRGFKFTKGGSIC